MIQTADLSNNLEFFAQLATDTPSYGADWLESLRREALSEFLRLGFPTTHDEQWRLTNVAPILRTAFVRPGPRSATRQQLAHLIGTVSLRAIDSHELVFVNGEFWPEFSSTKGLSIHVGTISEAIHRNDQTSELIARNLGRQTAAVVDGFAALNVAGFRDGAFIHVPDETIITQPIHLLFLTISGDEPVIVQPRILIVAGHGVQATFVQSYAGAGETANLANAACELCIGANARIEMVKLQRETPQAFHVAHDHVRLRQGANFQSLVINIGGALVRNDLAVILDGPGAEATLNGLTLSTGRQHIDNHTMLDHACDHCPSHELYKCLLGGSSSGVFKGKILVRPGAQKTDAKQTSKSVLLSDEAVMNSQPQLEIYADDVKCTHGSTTGPLDDEQLFYLRSRGIEEAQARALLTYAFARDVLYRTWHHGLRSYLETLIVAELHRLHLDQAT
ncbi:MAG TPA: Fe-S cluster assembly protein SufD [Phycisphaerae bacterium]|nr:Fe-S cluster assembly protein SufD [Phycisphaerae bacterium]